MFSLELVIFIYIYFIYLGIILKLIWSFRYLVDTDFLNVERDFFNVNLVCILKIRKVVEIVVCICGM